MDTWIHGSGDSRVNDILDILMAKGAEKMTR
jgi:hypothetical protein